MGKDDGGEAGSEVVILPDGFGSSFSTQAIRAKVSHKIIFVLYVCMEKCMKKDSIPVLQYPQGPRQHFEIREGQTFFGGFEWGEIFF